MRFSVNVRISYRSRLMPEDTALALGAVLELVDRLPGIALSWCIDSTNGARTSATARWEDVQLKAETVAREAATVGWADPSEAEIEVVILPGGRSRAASGTNWADVFLESGRRFEDS